ncbi:LysE family transporter [Rummeliibacillus sp. POC4]|uniref:LysE family transporter n=1 Tax=Rummeliibacillus sp. POC4 TaxID=2305899 RepID=UPI000E673013|nr:LysE family transporter [Rummeliibacillus sp. POC4]RIJ63210.1 amino acid transporter [Rummeliibacillus sp. POC4]
MSIFFSYVFLGISLAAPIGPINAAQIDKGIKGGFFPSWFVGLGAMCADALYMLTVYLGVINFLDTPFMQTLLWSFGFFVLVYTGIESIVSVGKTIQRSNDHNFSLTKSFFSGFFMSLLNPLTILFWLGIYGSVLAKTVVDYETADVILYSSAIFLGLFFWDITMACVASSFRKYLTTKLLAFISIVSGLSLIGFGVYFGIQAVKLLASH